MDINENTVLKDTTNKIISNFRSENIFSLKTIRDPTNKIQKKLLFPYDCSLSLSLSKWGSKYNHYECSNNKLITKVFGSPLT